MNVQKHWKVVVACIFMLLLLIIGLTVGLVPTPVALPLSGIVDLTYARYQGVSLYNGVDQFLGMRYASPPVKDLRWRAPQDPENSKYVVQARSVRTKIPRSLRPPEPY